MLRKNPPRRLSRSASRQGAMLVLVAVTLPLVVIMAAFAIDVAWMQLVRTELRTATDAASRAGAKTLGLAQSEAAARAAARDAASRNLVAGVPLQVVDAEIEIGQGRQQNRNSRFVFNPAGALKNAVRVNGNRTNSSAGGPVDLFLGRVMGTSTFEPTQTATATQLDRDICLVLDRSGSMRGRKINDLKSAVAGFLDELDQTLAEEQVALVSYSTSSNIDEQLTVNYSTIRSTANSFQANGRTAIGLALRDGVRVMTNQQRRRPFALPIIVLMTDGRHNTSFEPIIPARRAARQEIVVHTITFGNNADFGRMRAVATATNGEHFHAPDAAALEEIFREIASTLPVLLTD